MKNALRLSYLVMAVLAFAAWATVWFKALYIPVTHDELASAVYYPKFSIWDLMMYPDPWPNNHILNSILTKILLHFFGTNQVVLRLTNVLGFGIYAYAAFQICRLLFPRNPWAMPGLYALMLLNPFLLDFFSLSRGYGLSASFVLLSAMFVLRGFMQQRAADLGWAVFAGMLAAYANFTALIVWAAVSGLAFIYFLHQQTSARTRWTHISLLALADACYLALVYTPLHKMQSTNQFEYWQSNGFFRETVLSLIQNSLYGSKMIDIPLDYFGVAAILFFCSLGAYAFYRWGRNGGEQVWRSPAMIAFALLALTVFINIMQTVILKTPNLTTRTTLLLHPLFILCVGAALHHLVEWRPRVGQITSLVLGVFCLYHMARTYQPRQVREWWYDANTFQVLDYLKSQQQGSDPVSITVDWRFHRSFDFYVQTGKAPYIALAPSKPQLDNQINTAYTYIFDSEYEMLKNTHDVVLKFDGGARMLLKHKPQ